MPSYLALFSLTSFFSPFQQTTTRSVSGNEVGKKNVTKKSLRRKSEPLLMPYCTQREFRFLRGPHSRLPDTANTTGGDETVVSRMRKQKTKKTNESNKTRERLYTYRNLAHEVACLSLLLAVHDTRRHPPERNPMAPLPLLSNLRNVALSPCYFFVPPS